MVVMRRFITLADVLCLALMACILLPGTAAQESPGPFLAVAVFAEGVYRCRRYRQPGARAPGDIASLVFAFFLLWECCTTKLGIANKILIPSPEKVFWVFIRQWKVMGEGVISSLSLILAGFLIALSLGISLGLYVGLTPRLKGLFLPVAKVISPIPPIVCGPYIIALMPTFRSASLMILVLGIFWPNFMKTIQQTGSMDSRLLDSAKVMNLKTGTMVFRIFLPYLMPEILSGVKISLSTSFMLLSMAEMMGAASGLGYYIRRNTDFANYTNVVAGIILVGAVITLLNGALHILEKRLVKWKP